MGSCDRLEITFTNCFAQQMTLWVYSSVAYIVCILDNEGKRFEKVMCPEGLLTPLPPLPLQTQIQCLKNVYAASFAGAVPRRGAPPSADIAECAPPFFFLLRQPNLNLTMEPAQ